MSIENQVTRARELLGARLTAYLVGRKTTNMDNLTDYEKVDLRSALIITAALNSGRADMSGPTTPTWWMGMNPMLNDLAPAQVLRQEGGWASVMTAAQHDANA